MCIQRDLGFVDGLRVRGESTDKGIANIFPTIGKILVGPSAGGIVGDPN
jgi:hypothetical protein